MTAGRHRAAAVLMAAALATSALAGSETPPEGPPWVRDLHAAQVEGLTQGKPIFVYLTKTH